MTPDETTTEGKSSRRYWAFVLIGAVVLVAAALIFWTRGGGRQPLSLTVLGYGTNYVGKPSYLVNLSYHSASHPGSVLAHVTATNSTNEAVVLGSVCVLREGKSGWKSPEVARASNI